MSKAYIIQLSSNTGYCLGVNVAGPNAKVVLSTLRGAGDALTQWHIDPNSGHITLAGSDPDDPLFLDYEGSSPSNGVAVIVTSFVLGRNSQRWNWLGNPPYLMNQNAPEFCIDNSGGNVKAGNKIQISTQKKGNLHEQWQFQPVPVLMAALRS